MSSTGVTGENNRLASPERAVLAQSTCHYDLLRTAFPDMDSLEDAQTARSGENLLIDGLDRFNLCVGDIFAVESPQGTKRACTLQVSSPRKPCRRWDRKYGSANGLSLRHFVLTNTCGGWFFRVTHPGTIAKGDRVVLVKRTYPQWSLERLGRKLYGCSGGHVDTWTNWTGRPAELKELSELEALAMREWRAQLIALQAAAETSGESSK